VQSFYLSNLLNFNHLFLTIIFLFFNPYHSIQSIQQLKPQKIRDKLLLFLKNKHRFSHYKIIINPDFNFPNLESSIQEANILWFL
jgi:hypothetical protein